jgi:pyrimidine-nucleoside phosphorylase
MVRAQGGDPRIVDGGVLPRARAQKEALAGRDGFVAAIDTEMLGTAAMVLGAGREKVEDVIDPGAGLSVGKKLGDEVRKGEPLVTFHYNDSSRLSEAERMVQKAYSIGDARRPSAPELILAVLEQ